MKKILVLTAILIAQINYAQVTKNLGDFDEVKVFDRISVELVPSDENRIVISGNRSSDVEVVNNNGQLKIRMKLEKLLSGEEINAVLYTRGIKGIDATEGAYVSSNATIEQDELDLDAKEGAQIKLKVGVRELDVRAVTGAKIMLSGTADDQEITIGTGGIVEAAGLVTTRTDVEIKAGGEAEVNASEKVDADIKAGGNIVIYGNPRIVNEKTTLGGTIKRAKE